MGVGAAAREIGWFGASQTCGHRQMRVLGDGVLTLVTGPPCAAAASCPTASRAEPVRDIRCEFCGEFFENRKGLSSHARSHLRQMGVTEWSVNGSPIDTLREILKKKTKPCLIKKEPPAGDLAPALVEDGPHLVAPGPMQSVLPLVPMAGRPGRPAAGLGHLPRELVLAPLSSSKAAVGYLGSMSTKRPLQDDRLLSPEVKAKTYVQTELPFKAKALHDKGSHSGKPHSGPACCPVTQFPCSFPMAPVLSGALCPQPRRPAASCAACTSRTARRWRAMRGRTCGSSV